MKYSKDSHVKSAVGRANEKGERGLLYYSPKKNEKVMIDIDKRVRDRNNRAARLYSVLNRNAKVFDDGPRDKNQIAKKIIDDFSKRFTEQKLFQPGVPGDINAIYRCLKVSAAGDAGRFEMESMDFASAVIQKALRKSLRREITWEYNGQKKKYDLSDIAARLLCAVSVDGSDEQLKDISEDEVLAFVGYANQDRTGEVRKTRKKGEKGAAQNEETVTRQEEVARSLKNQNVKVQVCEKNINGESRKVLMLSNAEHPKKHFIADFLKEYAAAEKEEQETLIWHMKTLIISYVYGEQEEDLKTEDKNVWGKMPRLPESDELFSGISMPEEGEYLDEKEIKNAVAAHYRQAAGRAGTTDSDRFWLEYFEKSIEKLAAVKRKRKPFYFMRYMLSDYLWKEWFPFIAMKFVDLGKGVYHFATPNLNKIRGNRPVTFGVVRKEFEEGISSFDYERIKAEESLKRDIAVSVAFSAGIFAKAAIKDEYRLKENKEDALFIPSTDYEKAFRSDAKHRILRYFGGESLWKEAVKDQSDQEMVVTCMRHLRGLRNMSFHYSSKTEKRPEDGSYALGRKLFEQEYRQLGRLIGEKYYSNNVPVYYNEDQIYALIGELYKQETAREAYIPSFNRIVKKMDMRQVIDQYISTESRKAVSQDLDVLDRYRASLYFVLKEIYYHGFLQCDNLLERFKKSMKGTEARVKKR